MIWTKNYLQKQNPKIKTNSKESKGIPRDSTNYKEIQDIFCPKKIIYRSKIIKFVQIPRNSGKVGEKGSLIMLAKNAN